jgi:hypothetical protein
MKAQLLRSYTRDTPPQLRRIGGGGTMALALDGDPPMALPAALS